MSAITDVLIKENIITEEQLRDALDKQLGAKRPIQDLLLEMNFIKEEGLIKIMSEVFKMPITDLEKEEIDPSAVKLISYETAKRYGVFPVRKEGNTLILAMSDPQDIVALDDIRTLVNMQVKPLLSTKSQISASIENYYQLDETLYDLLKNIANDIKIEIVPADSKLNTVGFEASNSAIASLVNLIFSDAIRQKASDIHIEPQADSVGIRYRVDGELKNIVNIPKKMQLYLVSRIKILAELDIAETRKPQDGRTSISVYGRDIDLRISTIPTFYGEKIALRLLDPDSAKVELNKLGIEEFELDIITEAINRPQGMVLVTGPTGSGKTSTNYAALNYIKNKTKNIITIEDPIEYLIGGINQIQVNPIKDVTFANGLRSILRQDPDVILVGEIRDKETAEIAFRASLTGHLVFTTLHTNNSVSSITRLLDIGLEPYLISSSILLIVAQRLLKVVCPCCKGQYSPEIGLIEKLNFYLDKYKVKEYYRGEGCEKCNYTGFSGRTAIFEMLKNNEKIRSLISNKACEDEIFKEAKIFGLRPLAEAGIEKVAKGITTLEEVARITDIIEEGGIKSPVEKHKKPKVLVVDDDILIRKMVIEAFDREKDKFEFIEAQNGQEALRFTYDMRPDLLISDVIMPQMDGYELTKTLRSRLEGASIPIIMLTSQKEKENEIKGLDVGADDYITKPFDKDKLLARAKMLLRRVK